MNRVTSFAIAAAASAVILPAVRADYLPVFGAAAATPSGAIIFSTTSPVATVAGEGVAGFNVSYFSGTSGIMATRFTAAGTIETLDPVSVFGTNKPVVTLTTVTAGGLALGSSSQSASSTSTRAVYWAPGTTTPTVLNSINDYAAVTPGQTSGVANAVNAGGLIVGSSGRYSDDGFSGLGSRAVYWAAGSTTPVELGNLGTTNGPTDNTGVTYASAAAVNASGTIVGYAKYSGFSNSSNTLNAHAVRWTTANTTAVDLGVLSYSNGDAATGTSNSLATAINSSGTAIGSSMLYDLARYNAPTVPTSLPNGPTGPNGTAGYTLGTRAVRWDAGATTPTELKPLNVTTFDVYNSRSFTFTYAGTGAATANDINDAGTTVGISTLYAPQTGATQGQNLTPATYGSRAVYWAPGSTTAVELPYLGTLASGTTTYTTANAINEDGVISGQAAVNGVFATQRATMWRAADHSIVNLNDFVDPTSGYVLTSATSISEALNTNSYTVTGLATLSGTTRAYLVNVPRPMYFTNGLGGDLASLSGGQTNFATNVAGTNISTQLPTGGNDVFFASANASGLTTTLGSNFTVNSLTFGTGTSVTTPVTVNGTGTLTVNGGLSVVYAAGTGILKQAGSAAVTINAPLAVATNQSWTNNSATALTVNGSVGLGASTLTLAGTGSTAITGAVTGTGGIAKTGTGGVTLAGVNTYGGTTTVSAGTLTATAAATSNLLTNTGGVDLGNTGGKLVLDYTGGSSPVASIKSILTSGYAGAFATGQIRSTTLASTRTIGYGDDGVSAVTVRVTLAGDADLDGDVDFNDFLTLQTNYGATDTRFDQGNFDYNGVTDFNDFLALQTNFGQSISPDSVASFTAEQYAAVMAITSASAVPEPASLALFGLGATGLLRRRRA